MLAGFPDDRADEGPAAGPRPWSVSQIARENGWNRAEAGRKPLTSSPTGGSAEAAVKTADTSARRVGDEAGRVPDERRGRQGFQPRG